MAPARGRWPRIFAGSAGAFVLLTVLVSLLGLLPGESQLYQSVVNEASPRVVSIFQGVNYLGDKRFLLPGTVVLLWAAPSAARRRWWLWVGVMILAPVLEGLGKELIGRPRPEGHAPGFPSGHVTAAAAYFFLAAYLLGKRLTASRGIAIVLWAGAALAVILVGFARVVLQAHWPGDALGGAALGLACVSLAAWWYDRASPPAA